MNAHQTFRSARTSLALLPLLLLFAFTAPATADVIGVSVTVAPPALPVYVQPPCPGDGYLWTPGYWAWADGDYYWVPGTWVLAPEPGLLWTPGYWAWEEVQFVFHEGYWAPHVGFYGGIDYGFGYGGAGFEGGYWESGRFHYNRATANVSETNVHNVYTKTVIHNTINVISYNGGRGGTTARPSTAELHSATERHMPPVASQNEHMRTARNDPTLRAESNHGQPLIAATRRVSEFSGHDVVHASQPGEPYHPAAERRVAAGKPDEAQAMHARQQSERQELRDRQAAEQAQIERQHGSEERRQAMAAAHAGQQQELARRHEQEEQEFEAQHKRRDQP